MGDLTIGNLPLSNNTGATNQNSGVNIGNGNALNSNSSVIVGNQAIPQQGNAS